MNGATPAPRARVESPPRAGESNIRWGAAFVIDAILAGLPATIAVEKHAGFRRICADMKFSLHLVLVSMLVVTAGCATSRRAARAAQDAAKVPPGERTVTAAEAGLNADVPLTLARAIQIAARFHPAIVQAKQEVEVARANVDAVRAAADVKIGSSAGYRRATANTAPERGSHDTKDAYNAGLSADLLIYDFGKTPALHREAVARQLAAEFGLQAARNDVSYAARTAYLTLAENIDLLDVARETVRQFEVRLTQAQGLFEVGNRIKYDLTKAQVDLGNAQLQLINASNAVTTSRAALNRAMGLAEDPDYRLAPAPPDDIHTGLKLLMLTAHATQPDLRALQAEVDAALFAVDAAIADLYPSLGLGAALNWTGASFPLVWNWSAALDAAMNLFDSGGRNSRIVAATARLRSARARQAAREQQIFAELSQALARLDGARQRHKLTDLIVQQARESRDLVNERYRIGLATAVELTDAQAALASALAQQVAARYDVLTEVATIKHTIGEP